MRRLPITSTNFVGLVALALSGACTIPTDAPVTDVRWIVPGQTTRIAVANLLPTNVSILADSSAFSLTVAAVSVTRTLSQDCPACIPANGLVAPKPAFVGTATASSNLPADISSAALSGGTLQISVQHNYTFDPLRPSAAAGAPRGKAVFTVTSGSTVIGRDSLQGTTTALPPGTAVPLAIALSGNVSSSTPLTVNVSLDSPAGDPVLMDVSRSLTVTATPTGLRVPTANVAVVNRIVRDSSTENLTDVDQSLIDRVQSGALNLTIANPFSATGTLTITLTPSGGTPIVKSVPLAAGSSTPSVPFTGAELKQLLGRSVKIVYSGTVNGTSGAVAVSPKQAVVVQSRLDLSLQLGTIKT